MMKSLLLSAAKLIIPVLVALAVSNPYDVHAESVGTLVDDFSHTTTNSLGHERQFMNDTLSGGKTHAEEQITSGVIHLSGKIVPPRGQPGWSSAILPLAPFGEHQDVSNYQGIRLRIKLNHGNLTLSANSTEITNFDYHTAPLVVKTDGEFHDVEVPFASMKRMWSEQVALNTKTITSLSIVAFSLQPADYSFEVDEVTFY
ncbi:CIA30 family protein [Alteromonas sp. KUL49]|uniref:CIA30 family protein n=1 Tax=Alteromonas sp. KUL49 TaxID=2480798 RepID=UPI0010FFB75D|nr:CIA30 family protein [Alteromonas sp. KUL49]GEA12168.1 hypothetical protein KUL49_25430 [Alteromonas sp. KUL49]